MIINSHYYSKTRRMKILYIIFLGLICTNIFSQNTELYKRWNKTDSLIMIKKIGKDAAIDSTKI